MTYDNKDLLCTGLIGVCFGFMAGSCVAYVLYNDLLNTTRTDSELETGVSHVTPADASVEPTTARGSYEWPLEIRHCGGPHEPVVIDGPCPSKTPKAKSAPRSSSMSAGFDPVMAF